MSENYENNNLDNGYAENYYNSENKDTNTFSGVNNNQTETPKSETIFNYSDTQQNEVSHFETSNQQTETVKSEKEENDSTYHFTGSQIPSDDSYSNYHSYNQGSDYGNSYSGTRNNNNTDSYTNQTKDFNNNTYSNSYGTGNTNSSFNSYGTQNYSSSYSTEYGVNQNHKKAEKVKTKKPKKEKKPVTRGALAAILIISIIFSGALGIGGGFVAAKYFGSNGITISKTNSNNENQGSATASRNETGGLSTSEIVAKTANSVVEITTETVTTGSFFQQYVATGAGSGVIISDDGYILTNNHVIDGANTVKVTTKDSTEYDAEIIGADAKLDVALLKINAKELTPATFGDSSTIQVGDYAVAIGNPLGQLGGTVTDGIVSALDRDVTVDNETMRLLQTDAAINPGNSGGGLFNSSGELIGIVCAKASSSSTEVEGLGFAIPINNVLDILNDLKEYGYVKGRVDLGMTLSNVQSSTAYQPGVYVNSVSSGSSADKAGFQKGDLITKVNGTEVKSVSDVNGIIENLNVGDTVKFSVTRGTRSGELSLTLEEYNPAQNSLTNDNNANNQLPDNGGGSIWDYFNW